MFPCFHVQLSTQENGVKNSQLPLKVAANVFLKAEVWVFVFMKVRGLTTAHLKDSPKNFPVNHKNNKQQKVKSHYGNSSLLPRLEVLLCMN